MSKLKLISDSGGGSVSLKAPATTTGNAALEFTVPDVATGATVLTSESSLTSSKLTGALPAISGASLTGITSSDTLPFRNLIINGDFQIAQRSTAAVTTSNGSNEKYQTVDRFRIDMDNSVAVFTQQQVDLTAATDPDGFYKALKIDCTTADASVGAGDWVSLQQEVEGLNWSRLNYGRSDAKTITVSFWVKSTKTGTYSFSIRNSAADRYYVAEYTVSASDTWEKKTITIAGDTSGTWLITNGIGARLGWSLIIGSTDSATAGSWAAGNKFGSTNQVNFFDNTSNNFYITGVQLEVGSKATEFEHRSYADGLRKCQRYFHRHCSADSTPIAQGMTYYSGQAICPVSFPTTMRTKPSMTSYAGGAGAYTYRVVIHDASVYHHTIGMEATMSSESIATVTCDASGQDHEANGVILLAHAGSPTNVAFDAEL